jgi:hypothetical protein
MIKLEVSKSSDDTALGLYDFNFDIIYVGRSLKNDLIFLDRELPLKYIEIKILEDQGAPTLIMKSLEKEPFFFVNGKKISGQLKVRPGDLIAFGPNQLKIISFEKNQSEFDLAEAYERFDKNAPDLKFALEFIEEVLIDQEGQRNV